MAKRKKKSNLCTRQISFRCTEKQKEMLKELSEQRGIGQKEFILKCIHESVAKEKRHTEKEINIAACACNVQELVNYLRKHEVKDSYVEGVCEKLWDLVN